MAKRKAARALDGVQGQAKRTSGARKAAGRRSREKGREPKNGRPQRAGRPRKRQKSPETGRQRRAPSAHGRPPASAPPVKATKSAAPKARKQDGEDHPGKLSVRASAAPRGKRPAIPVLRKPPASIANAGSFATKTSLSRELRRRLWTSTELASAVRTGRRQLKDRYDEHTETSPALTAGDVDADWESAYSVGDEAPGGDNPRRTRTSWTTSAARWASNTRTTRSSRARRRSPSAIEIAGSWIRPRLTIGTIDSPWSLVGPSSVLGPSLVLGPWSVGHPFSGAFRLREPSLVHLPGKTRYTCRTSQIAICCALRARRSRGIRGALPPVRARGVPLDSPDRARAGSRRGCLVEAFWRAYRGRARFDPSRSFGAWMRRIATNCAIDQLKAIRRRDRHEAVGRVPPRAILPRAADPADPPIRSRGQHPPCIRVVAAEASGRRDSGADRGAAANGDCRRTGTATRNGQRLFRATRDLRSADRLGIQT